MIIPEERKRTIRALVKADPEVAQATCDIPHLDPSTYLIRREEAELPYCGCFIGVYAWMMECKRGNKIDLDDFPPQIIATILELSEYDIEEFAMWCKTVERDEEAVRYARGLLS